MVGSVVFVCLALRQRSVLDRSTRNHKPSSDTFYMQIALLSQLVTDIGLCGVPRQHQRSSQIDYSSHLPTSSSFGELITVTNSAPAILCPFNRQATLANRSAVISSTPTTLCLDERPTDLR